MFRNQYDSDVTVWSPQGRLHQVEYAMEAVKLGSATVGLKNKQYAVLIALKRAVSELSAYQKKIIPIDEHIGISISGLTADARMLSRFMRTECLNHRYAHDSPMPVGRLISLVGNKMQICTQRYDKRPLGVGLLVAGYDDQGPHIYQTCPSANFFDCRAMAIGARSQSARTYLEKHLATFLDCNLQELVAHGLRALRDTLPNEVDLNTKLSYLDWQENMFVILIVLCSLLYGIYALTTSKFDYWKKRKVPYEKPVPLLGNYSGYFFFSKYLGDNAEEMCYKFTNEPYFGTFYGTEPALVVLDPEYLKLILTKDFYYFNGREVTEFSDSELITRNVFNQGGDKWKTIRQNMTPIFSSAKMKNMFYLIEKCARDLEKLTDIEFAASHNNVIETRMLMARYTISCIGSCVFGVETGTLDVMANLKDNMFLNIANFTTIPTRKQSLKIYVRSIWPSFFYALRCNLFPLNLSQYFRDLLTNVFKSRGYEPSSRNDFVDLLLSFAKNKHITGDCISNSKTGENKKYELEVNDELLIAQCIVLFLAGFETSAVTSSFVLFELAKKPEALKRCQAEVDSYLSRNKNCLTYDCVKDLPYIEACIDETLRLYPVLGLITREVVDDYTLPTGLRLEKGLRVHIPTHYLQRSPKHFNNPLEFCPDRFLGENKKKIHPYTYIPFGEGPRICLGMRFAKMQIIPGVMTILKKFDLELAEGMSSRPKFDPKSIIIQSQEGILLKYTPREGWEKRVYPS